jgi:hypothetical protein
MEACNQAVAANELLGRPWGAWSNGAARRAASATLSQDEALAKSGALAYQFRLGRHAAKGVDRGPKRDEESQKKEMPG